MLRLIRFVFLTFILFVTFSLILQSTGCSHTITNPIGADPQGSTTLTVNATVTTVTVTPANASCFPQNTVQFKAVDQNGRDITLESVWASSDPTKASITNTGLATCLAAGQTTITANHQ